MISVTSELSFNDFFSKSFALKKLYLSIKKSDNVLRKIWKAKLKETMRG